MPSAITPNGLLRVTATRSGRLAASLAVLLLATAAIVHLAHAQSSAVDFDLSVAKSQRADGHGYHRHYHPEQPRR